MSVFDDAESTHETSECTSYLFLNDPNSSNTGRNVETATSRVYPIFFLCDVGYSKHIFLTPQMLTESIDWFSRSCALCGVNHRKTIPHPIAEIDEKGDLTPDNYLILDVCKRCYVYAKSCAIEHTKKEPENITAGLI